MDGGWEGGKGVCEKACVRVCVCVYLSMRMYLYFHCVHFMLRSCDCLDV